MRWVPAAARRLQLHVRKRGRRPAGSVGRRERRQPEIGQFVLQRLSLLALDLAQRRLFGLARKRVDRALGEVELALCPARWRGEGGESDAGPECAEGDVHSFDSAPDVVTAAVAARPSWPFSNSSRTRSRAASRALRFSSSASRLSVSSLAFCRLMSCICVTVMLPFRDVGALKALYANTYRGQCRRTPCRRDVLSGMLPAPLLVVGTVRKRQTAAWTRSLDVAARLTMS